MKILEVNFADLTGHIFNGYDLHRELNNKGYECKQVVKRKQSNCETVISLAKDEYLTEQLEEWEREHSVRNVINPYGYGLERLNEFQNADIVHYHVMFDQAISLLDYPRLLENKKSIWTIHDPWIFTGNCIHPLKCEKWKEGCGNCTKIHDSLAYMEQDNSAFMWNLKKDVLSKINPDVVVASNFLEKFLEESPMTQHFNKIHVIPFGVDIEEYDLRKKSMYKKKMIGDDSSIVIGFRADNNAIKGCTYLYDALEILNAQNNITLICVGNGTIPDSINKKYRVIELGWVHDKKDMISFMEACDIFVMPSIAETFGLMSIEALAAGAAFICFKSTVMEEITEAPDCGIAAEYKSAKSLAEKIGYLLEHKSEIDERGRMGHELVKNKFTFKEYVRKHIDLYTSINQGGE